jgi:hypothetical protein
MDNETSTAATSRVPSRLCMARTPSHATIRSCGTGFYPRDAELGLPAEGGLSLEMERRVLDFAVSGPYEECAERWNVHYPMHPLSPNQFRQVAERVGKRLEASERRRL